MDSPEMRTSLEANRNPSSQGLEPDFPIIAWGNDRKWSGTSGQASPQPRSNAHDPHQLRLNSYRVLLSRGRAGLTVFVPPSTEMDATHTCLLGAGLTIVH